MDTDTIVNKELMFIVSGPRMSPEKARSVIEICQQGEVSFSIGDEQSEKLMLVKDFSLSPEIDKSVTVRFIWRGQINGAENLKPVWDFKRLLHTMSRALINQVVIPKESELTTEHFQFAGIEVSGAFLAVDEKKFEQII